MTVIPTVLFMGGLLGARKGFRWCEAGQHNRAEKFFSGPRAKKCSTCLRKTRSKSSHATRVQAIYELGPGEYEALRASQGSCCAICGRKPRYRMDVDHCHTTNLVRGLLCKLCNRRILPAARDEPETLRRAASYLENPPALKYLGERRYQGP